MPFLTNDPLPQCLQPSPLTPLLLAQGHQRGSRRHLSNVKCLKAEGDFNKRCAEQIDFQDATFVFVTSRRWPDEIVKSGKKRTTKRKEDWQREKIANSRWKDVRVLDADDLETWL